MLTLTEPIPRDDKIKLGTDLNVFFAESRGHVDIDKCKSFNFVINNIVINNIVIDNIVINNITISIGWPPIRLRLQFNGKTNNIGRPAD